MCRARRDALNPPKLVKRRITGKKAPEHVEVACRVAPVVARPKRKQKRGGTMAKSDTVRSLLMDGRSSANTVATASQRRSMFTRVKRPHGLSGPKE